MAFEFTPHMTVVSNNLWAVTSAVGAGLCFLVLVIIAAVWSYPKSRAHLDRVSFRVVIYVVFANMLFGTASAIGGTRAGPGFLCGFSIFILQLTLQFSGFLLFSIALNLQLVVVHGKNGQRLEKYYLIGSALLAFALVIPPYAAHQYGWDPLEQDCWYTNDDRSQRIAWQVGTQTAWTFLTVIGELICSTKVLIFLFRHDLRLRKVFTLATGSMFHASRASSTAPQMIKATKYKSVILRVALYPAFSCVVNLLSIATVLHSTIANGIHNTTDYNVLLLSDFLYGGRAIVYGLLAASDPVSWFPNFTAVLSSPLSFLGSHPWGYHTRPSYPGFSGTDHESNRPHEHHVLR
ncbi:hypothetical protein DFH08DRAFT_779030 [Mycena albidolilacea]|uniref:G-protein coupled receptors family 2 profile 2 domain-containing protein n=1 Tax=Mycena albidolilacea TaxID=1033008 RepID=A0AAD7A358_9AGAR|nr:hypothetical protein DFH08DRAFT_779030 [Mycena albidolilacea]